MYTRCSLSVTPVARYTGVLEHSVYVYTRVCIIYDRNIAGCSFAHEHAVSVYLARYFPRKKKGGGRIEAGYEAFELKGERERPDLSSAIYFSNDLCFII